MIVFYYLFFVIYNFVFLEILILLLLDPLVKQEARSSSGGVTAGTSSHHGHHFPALTRARAQRRGEWGPEDCRPRIGGKGEAPQAPSPEDKRQVQDVSATTTQRCPTHHFPREESAATAPPQAGIMDPVLALAGKGQMTHRTEVTLRRWGGGREWSVMVVQ